MLESEIVRENWGKGRSVLIDFIMRTHFEQ